jgi:protein-tyrosine phosphatase
MIDLHSHILPQQDDGAQSLEQALSMADMAAESGVRAMVATPHCADDRRQEIYSAWKLLSQALQELHIPVKLYLGMEIYGTPDTARLLREGKLYTLNGSRYPLLEFDFHSDGWEETRILENVCAEGFRPLVAHPERYSYLWEEPRLLRRWHAMGCLFQVNRGSILGRFGSGAQQMAGRMLEEGLVTVVASDAHSDRVRTPWMADVRRLLREEFSQEYARLLLEENPRRIINNEEIPPAQPVGFA